MTVTNGNYDDIIYIELSNEELEKQQMESRNVEKALEALHRVSPVL